MRRRLRLRESPLAELFASTEARRRRDIRRGRRGASQFALIGPTGLAILLVGIVAAAALSISIWQLAHPRVAEPNGARAPGSGSSVPQPTGTAVSDAGAPATTAPPAETSASPEAKPKAAPAELVLTAAQGDCWLEVRRGSARGKRLFAGTLVRGETLRFAKKRLWLAFGAGGNLEVTLNEKRVEGFPTGTAAVVVTADGVGPPTPL